MNDTQQDKDILAQALKIGTIQDLRQASGKKMLTPEGFYPDCTVNIGRTVLSEKFPNDDGSAKYQFELTLSCPSTDVELKKWVTVSMNGKSGCFGLIKAVFPEEAARVGKSFKDCNGAKVNLIVSVKPSPSGMDYADFQYQSVKPALKKG